MVMQMQRELSERLISTDDSDFIEKVESKLRQGEPIIILLRYSHQGGNREYFIVKNIDEFRQILQKAHHRDALSIFFSQSFPVQGKVSDELKERMLDFLGKIIRDEEEAIFVIRLDTDKFTLWTDNMKVFSELNQIEEWCNKNLGVPVIVGLLAFWEDDSKSMVTAYVRDSDGQVRRGAY
jgi:hypothetical protein